MNIDKILKDALNIYHYGSFVYGTFQKKISDYDYIVILKDELFELDKQQYEHENCQYSFYISLLLYFSTIFLILSMGLSSSLMELSQLRVSIRSAMYLDILTLQYHSFSRSSGGL